MTSSPAPAIAPTLATLQDDPTIPIPHLVGGQPMAGHYSTMPVDHVERLVLWGSIVGLNGTRTVVVLNEIHGMPAYLDGIQRAIALPKRAKPLYADSIGPVQGWNVRLSRTGRAPIDVIMIHGGTIRYLGTPDQQEYAHMRATQRRHAGYLQRMEDSGREALRRVGVTTLALAKAEREWTNAICHAWDQHDRQRFTVAEIADAAKISAARVYQIKDSKKLASGQATP